MCDPHGGLTVEVGQGVRVAAQLRDLGVLHERDGQLAFPAQRVEAELDLGVHEEVGGVLADRVPARRAQRKAD